MKVEDRIAYRAENLRFKHGPTGWLFKFLDLLGIPIYNPDFKLFIDAPFFKGYKFHPYRFR